MQGKAANQQSKARGEHSSPSAPCRAGAGRYRRASSPAPCTQRPWSAASMRMPSEAMQSQTRRNNHACSSDKAEQAGVTSTRPREASELGQNEQETRRQQTAQEAATRTMGGRSRKASRMQSSAAARSLSTCAHGRQHEAKWHPHTGTQHCGWAAKAHIRRRRSSNVERRSRKGRLVGWQAQVEGLKEGSTHLGANDGEVDPGLAAARVEQQRPLQIPLQGSTTTTE